MSAEPYSHRGLTYVFGPAEPDAGEWRAVAEGLWWARLKVPGSLKHVNVWALEEEGGFAIVDTGLDLVGTREAWERLLDASPMTGARMTRLIGTHFHPDHIGLAGWLCERFAAPLWMSRTEWLMARLLVADRRETPPAEAFAYWRRAGWDEARIAAQAAKGWGQFASVVSPLPAAFVRLADGDNIRIGARNWRVLTGSGHSPEHVCLIDEAAGIMIAGDQVLPRITSNVSLTLSEPEGDPLGDWLRSIDKLRGLPDALLVLPSHGDPFTGLHARLDALAAGHANRLDALAEFLRRPARAVDCFGVLFGRAIDAASYGLATGEALAHLRYLARQGRIPVMDDSGISHFRRN